MVRLSGTISAPVDSAFGRLVEELTKRLQAGEAVDSGRRPGPSELRR